MQFAPAAVGTCTPCAMPELNPGPNSSRETAFAVVLVWLASTVSPVCWGYQPTLSPAWMPAVNELNLRLMVDADLWTSGSRRTLPGVGADRVGAPCVAVRGSCGALHGGQYGG